jgi:hypothetical protein
MVRFTVEIDCSCELGINHTRNLGKGVDDK